MPTLEKCMNCTEKCPQAELEHQIALGRMYATNELLALVRKIDGGQLVEVVRCKDCEWWNRPGCAIYIVDDTDKPKAEDYCSFGVRRRSDD